MSSVPSHLAANARASGSLLMAWFRGCSEYGKNVFIWPGTSRCWPRSSSCRCAQGRSTGESQHPKRTGDVDETEVGLAVAREAAGFCAMLRTSDLVGLRANTPARSRSPAHTAARRLGLSAGARTPNASAREPRLALEHYTPNQRMSWADEAACVKIRGRPTGCSCRPTDAAPG